MKGMLRRDFLKGLGALALTAAASCRRAQEYAIEPEGCPEWMLPGEATCFASCMPWATGAIPLLAVCHEGIPTSLQPNPHYAATRPGLPAFVQASLLDLYTPARPTAPAAHQRPWPWQGVGGAFRAWAKGLKEGRRAAVLLPEGYSPLRARLTEELAAACPGLSFYAWDSVAQARHATFTGLDTVIQSSMGAAATFPHGYGTLTTLTQNLPGLDFLLIATPADPAAFHPDFADALRQSPAETVRLVSLHPDTTASLCQYLIPQTHFLEEWGADADAYGNLCLRQPVTLPLRPALSEAEALLALLTGELPAGCLPGGRQTELPPIHAWLTQLAPGLEDALRRGILPHVAPLPVPLPPAEPGADAPISYLHPYYADGRFRHNLWLQETFCPLSGYAVAPTVFLPGESPAPVTVNAPGGQLPGWIQPGLTRPCLPLLPEWQHTRLQDIAATPGTRYPHHAARPLPPAAAAPSPPATRQQEDSDGRHLIIDLSACIGCGACTLACRAENNVPLVGEDELRYNRDIQWLRIDRYLDSQKQLHFVPAACRQCRNAPCEAVCPVHATVRTSDGLNAMVYPRCWGTRYCAAACPYHARTFNFRDYARASTAATRLPPNPHVTQRSRGVMEKCTYCVQRLQAAKRLGDTPRTACQLACPVGAIRLSRSRPAVPVDTRFDAANTQPATLYILNDE